MLSAWAGDAPAGSAPPAAELPPRREIFRAALGVSLAPIFVGNGAGALGGLAPGAEVLFEVHVASPLWLVARGRGSYSAFSQALESSSSSGGGDLGLRLEWPLARWVEIGGHVFVGATGFQSEMSGVPASEVSGVGGRGSAGVGAHFRFGDLFGLRLSCDLVRASHDWGEDATNGSFSATSVSGGPDPHVELTFTF